MIPVKAGATWNYEDLSFHGLSLSGIRTSMTMPELQISFDVAQGYPFVMPMKKFFITHGHLDHSAGIPYIISQKALMHMPTATFYMPPTLVEPLTEIMKLWEKIEHHTYKLDFKPVSDDPMPVNSNHFMKAFPTFHRVESFGYTLFKRHKKLHPRFSEADRETILEAKKRGEDVHQTFEIPLVSFTGDTKIEFLDSKDWVRKSKVLFLESTYIDSRKTIEQAREWGHTHLDEIIPRLDEIESEKIVLIHISSRYSTEEAKRLILAKVPEKHHHRIEVFPGR